MKYDLISFDPGETTGVAIWNYQHAKEKSRPIGMLQLGQDELDEFLKKLIRTKQIPGLFVVEDYQVNPAIPHHWSRVETVQVIGQLKAFARWHEIGIIMQRANIKDIAKLWSGIKVPKSHKDSHGPEAALHGFYYLHKQGIIPARVLEESAE